MRFDNIAAWIVIPAVAVGFFTNQNLGFITAGIFSGLVVIYFVFRKLHIKKREHNATKKIYEKQKLVGSESDAFKRSFTQVLAAGYEGDTEKVLTTMQYLISLRDASADFEKEGESTDAQVLPNYNAYEVLAHSKDCYGILEKMADQKPLSSEWFDNLSAALGIARNDFEVKTKLE